MGDHPIEALVLAYRSAALVASAIAEQVVPELGLSKKVFIYDQTELNSILNYQAFRHQLDYVRSELETLKKALQVPLTTATKAKTAVKPTPGPKIAPVLIPGLVEGGIKSVIDIIGLFRTDTTISSKDFTLDDGALIAATAVALTDKSCTVYQPSVHPLNLFDSASPLLDELTALRVAVIGMQLQVQSLKNDLQQQSDALARLIQASKDWNALGVAIGNEPDQKKKQDLIAKQDEAKRTQDRVVAEITTLIGAGQDVSPLDADALKAEKDGASRGLDPGNTILTSISTSLDGFQLTAFKADDSGTSALGRLLRAEKLYMAMTTPKPEPNPDNSRTGVGYFLVLKMAALGGEVKTKTNFFIPTRLYYAGGAVATYSLFDPSGVVKRSGTIGNKSPSIKVNQRDEQPGDFDPLVEKSKGKARSK